MTSKYAIVNMRDGVRRDVESFLIDNDSFPLLENMYLFRGRIERRSCFQAIGVDGRLKLNVGTTNGAGAITLLDGTGGFVIPTGVASFLINGSTLTDPGGASPVVLLTTGATTGTLNRSTGVLTTNALNTAVVYMPGLPVLGLRTLEVVPTTLQQNEINDELLIAFDDRYSYQFDSGTDDFIGKNSFYTAANKFIWTGLDSDQFWTCNYQRAFWATNNNAGYHAAQDASPVAERDGIRWYGTVAGTTGWANFNPQLTSSPTYLTGGLIVLPYKDRLVVLNTLEGADLSSTLRFSQRARWSQNGTVYYGTNPTNGSSDSSSWRSDVIGKGGFIDAPTSEAIISAEFVKDTLIVYFERSTWQLVYTNNETLPFIWQKINTELGTESTFSVVAFDKGVFGVGNYGIISTDSVNVERLDQKIPDEVFKIQNLNNGVKRVSGVRDYTAQLVYWAYPTRLGPTTNSVNYTLTFPNQLLVYNYVEGSWSIFDDSFTSFGYWQKLVDKTWAQMLRSWESTNEAWNSGVLQGKYPDVVAGNQRGFVQTFSQIAQVGQNTPSIPINNITTASYLITAPDHNFVIDDYVMFTGITGVTSTNTGGSPNNVIYRIATTPSSSTFTIAPTNPSLDIWSGTYTGLGLITHMPNMVVQTKEFNPFYESGKSFRLNYLDMLLDRTTDGEFTAQFYPNDQTSISIEDVIVSTAPENQPTYSTPNPNFQSNADKIWHRIYTNSYGGFIQNIFTMSDAQMRDLSITTSDITIQGMIYNVSESGRISYDI